METTKRILLFIILFFTIFFCTLPHFHPEDSFGLKYNALNDRLFHGTYYFFATLIIFLLYHNKIRIIHFIIILLVIAVLLEVVQYFIPGRSFSFLDMGSNIIGGIFALIIGGLWKKFVRKS